MRRVMVLIASGIWWTMAQAQPVVSVSTVGGGFSDGIGGASAHDGTNRLFVVEQAGRIRVWTGSGNVLTTPFLDINALTNGGGERGLLGLAFHPNYQSNGFFYVNYTDLSGDTVIARYSVSAGDPNVANAASGDIILTYAQGASNHNGGDLHFGPDGYLYISSGDGGADWFNSQNATNLLGKLLRIDVDGDDFPGDTERDYAIPADNPLVGIAGAREEIWHMGLRNPWRFSFDRNTGDLFIGDVGEGTWEEIDFQASASAGGENWGWPCYEGSDSFQTMGCGPSGDYDFPILELPHTGGNCSVIAGYRYRGAQYPNLTGYFFYSDWCTGIIWAASPTSRAPTGVPWQAEQAYDKLGGFTFTGFVEDENGELFLVGRETIYQLEGLSDLLFTDGFEVMK